jgi:hypothetical protein
MIHRGGRSESNRHSWKSGELECEPEFVRIKRMATGRGSEELVYEGPYQPSQRGYPGFAWVSDELLKPRALPYACVNCGPLLFSLPIPEKDDNTPAEGAKYQYALDLPPAEAAQVQVTRRPMPAHWDWPYDAPVSLEVPARPFDWKPTNTQDLPSAPVEGGEREMLKLVPYGCTKFHISMFPVTLHAWGQRP